jgi:enoyl-CoA hydratase/carnithine racemase
MTYDTLTITTPREHIQVITLNRPEAMNAYNATLVSEVVEAVLTADTDESVRCVVLTGTGRGFCTGIDIDEMRLDPSLEYAEFEDVLSDFQDVVRTLRTIKTPVVAAINGYALGAGCDTALACDFRIVCDSSVLGESFIDVGLIPGDGGAYLLPRLIGEERAKELLMTGKWLEGDDIEEWGLARSVVEDDSLLEETLNFAESLASKAPVAVGEIKSLVNESFDVTLEEAIENATRAERIVTQTRDHEVALRAVQTDEEPSFEGR